MVTFARSSLAESGISIFEKRFNVGRDGFWSDKNFCGERSNVNSWGFLLKLVGLGFVCSVTFFLLCFCFFLFGAVLFG